MYYKELGQTIEYLTSTKLEMALLYLYQPKSKHIPKELSKLTELQWLILDQILDNLLSEKEESTLH